MAQEKEPKEVAVEETMTATETPVQEKPMESTNEPVTTNRDAFLANMRKKYQDVTDEDELYGRAMSGYDEDHEWRKNQSAANKAFADIVNKEPEVAKFYKEATEGGDAGVAMLNFSDLYKAYMNGDMGSEEFKQKREEQKQAAAEKEKSIAAQTDAFEKWCAKKGYDPEEWMNQANEKLFTAMGKYQLAEEQFDSLDKMFNYDEDVEAAKTQGRNANIMAQRKEMAKNATDGLPSGGNASADLMTRTNTKFDDIAALRNRRKNL